MGGNTKSIINVGYKRLRPDAQMPLYATAEAAGADLFAVEDVTLTPGKRALVSTGISIELDPGFEAQIRPRSGLAFKHGVTVLNAPGTIDSDYRGELKVLLINHGDTIFGIRAGDRVAQLVIAPVTTAHFFHVDEDLSTTDRGEGGFGSTGA
ncbi:dUTP diphosphatase [Ancylobacter rudongensis]|uniref:Deoxyuridine 5'-triphosphate nucleotidohydrolase n=1 Tax=Ancylobacter rudongensis TaxID=177413 RepID=A0A1G4UQJ9_9HYPH|nr:dUTP diphosphatase [Ancylobacter rudongensis]SCW95913.1 deoxyuridine 5'-triphosphate nucleotidohydrolase [Ancylobacter rudongensis]